MTRAMTTATPYEPPPYPYDRLNKLKPLGNRFDGGLVNLSIGAPQDAPPAAVIAALSTSDQERGYPPSIGFPDTREACAEWFNRRFGIELPSSQIAACVGSKEFVVTTPHFLHLRRPDRDTVLYPAISYPSYAMGAELFGLRAVAVPVDSEWRLDLSAIDPADAARALCLWVNTPGNPAGGLDDLAAVAAWGHEHDVTVLSDECYIEFTWAGPGRSVLRHATDGVLALHSLSKRSNFAGGRFGFYGGDAELVHYLSEVRKHVGNLVPGPVQVASAVALRDDEHVDLQRERYLERLEFMAGVLRSIGLDATVPDGGFYLWVPAPDGDAWALADRLATDGGVLVSPGDFYGPAGSGHVRVAVVDAIERLQLVADRLS